MGSRRLLSLSDALVLLGADPPRLAALDRSLGGVLAVATGGVSDGLLRIADARGRILGLGRDAVRGVGARLGAADGRVERGEMLRAAHTVVVVLGWFEALAEQDLPFSLEAVRITRGDQLSLVGAGEADAGFARALAAVDAPFPAPHLAPEDAARELLGWYTALSGRFLRFVSGLAVWDTLTCGRAGRRGAGSDGCAARCGVRPLRQPLRPTRPAGTRVRILGHADRAPGDAGRCTAGPRGNRGAARRYGVARPAPRGCRGRPGALPRGGALPSGPGRGVGARRHPRTGPGGDVSGPGLPGAAGGRAARADGRGMVGTGSGAGGLDPLSRSAR